MQAQREIGLGPLEEAILAAAKRTFGPERNLNATYNEEKGAVDLSQAIKIVDTIEDAPRNDAFTATLELYDDSKDGLTTVKKSKLVGDVITNSKIFEVRIVRR